MMKFKEFLNPEEADYDIKSLDELFRKVIDLNLLSIPEDLKDLVANAKLYKKLKGKK